MYFAYSYDRQEAYSYVNFADGTEKELKWNEIAHRNNPKSLKFKAGRCGESLGRQFNGLMYNIIVRFDTHAYMNNMKDLKNYL